MIRGLVLLAALVACDDSAGGSTPADTSVGDVTVSPDGGALPDAAPADMDLVDGALLDAGTVDSTTPDSTMRDGALPDGALPDGALPDGALPDAAPVPDGVRLQGGRLLILGGSAMSEGQDLEGAATTGAHTSTAGDNRLTGRLLP